MGQAILEKVKVYRMSNSQNDCPWGIKAVKLLQEREIAFEDHKLPTSKEVEAFKLKYHVATTPQIFANSVRIGGYSDLAKKLGVNPEIIGNSPKKKTYTPVVTIFSTAGLMALATSMGIAGFMGFLYLCSLL